MKKVEKLSKFQRIYSRDAKTSQNPLFGDTFWRFKGSSKVEKGPHIKNMENSIYSTAYLLKNTYNFVILVFSQLQSVLKIVVFAKKF
jgi:hypothetical protein